MNQDISHTEQQIEVINPMAVMGTVKSMVPRSFEKTFSGLTTEQISYSFKICLDGLTRDQIQVGMCQVRDNGFCPDPAMFRKWCLGIKGFNNKNPIESSYKGKFAAVANIEAWLSDSSTLITNAEREAYNRIYGMFDKYLDKVSYSDKFEREKFYAYKAFEDAYDEVVREFVSKGIEQCVFDNSLQIEQKKEKRAVTSVNEDPLNWSDHIHGYIIGRTGFRHEKIEIDVSGIQKYAKENNVNFSDAELEIRSLKINQICWRVEN